MKAENVLKKLSRFTKVEATPSGYSALLGGDEITFRVQNGIAGGYHVRNQKDEPDPHSDYFPGFYWDTIGQAVAAAISHYAGELYKLKGDGRKLYEVARKKCEPIHYLVLADWLEENGQAEWAEKIRAIVPTPT
jgi:hypothetical protein